MIIKGEKAIIAMREGGKILAQILEKLSENTVAGKKTEELEDLATKLSQKYGVIPAFKNYKPSGSFEAYPFGLCISINEEVVHGLPGERLIKEGDIVSLDFGILHKGFITDSAVTVAVGEITEEARKLMKVTKKSLFLGIKEVVAGARIGDISFAIQKGVESEGLNVFKSLAGHGVGETLHEDPTIPNYGRQNTGPKLEEGMTLAIEVMVTTGAGELEVEEDNWTLVSADGKLAAQFEHTVLVTKNGYEILTQK